ncbi:MAG: hypothetical protein KGI24_09515 [Candidatus Omnitrophica bacterium]|nr:hypothetical protein [Candidatus Omnitrophota bacterium]
MSHPNKAAPKHILLIFQPAWLDFLLKEWLLLISAVGLFLTSIHIKKFPTISLSEWEVLLILYALFIAVKGLEKSGLFTWISWRIEQGKYLPLKLILTTFFLSMIVTNDVALIIIVPITLALRIPRKDIVVIMEALAANAGSALTPIGNPQNLFIYWYYHASPAGFMIAIAPLTLSFLLILAYWAANLPQNSNKNPLKNSAPPDHSAISHGLLLLIMILVVLHLVPVWSSVLMLIYGIIFSRSSFLIDYPLLLTFFCFFGLADNLQGILADRIGNLKHVFLYSAFFSQIMSNVPASILFAKFTTQWKALLWGTNVGGFGSLVGSLANIIAYKLYIAKKSHKEIMKFTAKFLLIGYGAFVIGIGIYSFLVGKI